MLFGVSMLLSILNMMQSVFSSFKINLFSRKKCFVHSITILPCFIMCEKSNIDDDITTADILAQAMIYLVGGFDTISRNLDFLCYELALNKSVQDRLRKEIMEFKGATNCKLTYESISKLKYMDSVLSETLRKYPVMSGTDRICTKPYVIEPAGPGENPLVIEKDTVVWLPVYSLHHDPKNFENPEVFDPERFSEENGHSVDPYTYIPFGVGPRNCIGARFSILNVKAMVFHLLSNFELFPSKKTKIPLKWRKNTFFIVPSSDICIEIRRVK
ncbi:cytochrome P450 3A19-like isoform X2 [Leptinotarsa decemlineata]|uniref:cytochrome P450 3A19-like isoform X2 n=1 Tax=Leptinotarsa decemlineata TaxID=7539 RepID=UPI003D304D72